MINFALMQHWQNWLYVGFVATLVAVSIASVKSSNKGSN